MLILLLVLFYLFTCFAFSFSLGTVIRKICYSHISVPIGGTEIKGHQTDFAISVTFGSFDCVFVFASVLRFA